jgi:hypothetical protein
MNLPAAAQGNKFSIAVRSYDILPDARFVGLVVASGADLSRAVSRPRFVSSSIGSGN